MAEELEGRPGLEVVVRQSLPQRVGTVVGPRDQPSPADVADARHCGVCNRDVHFCHDIETARAHVQLGECVVVRSGLPRAPFDLSTDPLEAEAWACLLDDPRLSLTKDGPK